MKPEELVEQLHWLGHDTFCLDGPPVIYFDPWQISGKHIPADLVLVTHEHYDHCSPDDVAKISDPHTIVIAPLEAAAKLPGALVMTVGDNMSVAGVSIETVPAFNISKFRAPGQPFHPQTAGHVGYIVTIGGVRLYFAGDTDYIAEMDRIRCDVALLPVSGTYVMTVEEALEAARAIRPKIVVPMHYGSGIGQADDGQRFADLYEGQTQVLNRE